MKTLHFTGRDAVEKARVKAKYGHRDWVVWRDRDGEIHAAVSNYENFKAAMLAVGTQGRFTVLAASTGIGHTIRWQVAVAWLSNIRHGYA
jgi:hypothetical protein